MQPPFRNPFDTNQIDISPENDNNHLNSQQSLPVTSLTTQNKAKQGKLIKKQKIYGNIEKMRVDQSNYNKQKEMIDEINRTVSLSNPSRNKRFSLKNQRRIWKTSIGTQFIQFWQTLFNRRIFSFGSFALQIGDAFIMAILIGFIIYYQIYVKHTKNSGRFCDCLMAATIVFGLRNGFLKSVVGLSLERAILWHRVMAWITLILSIKHWILCFYLWKFHGYMIQSTIMAFIIFSLSPIRRKFWEFFKWMHWLIIVFAIPACYFHKCYITLSFIGYLFLGLIYRGFKIIRNKRSSKHITLERIGDNITKIAMPKKNIKYQGGQYFFVMIPEISFFEWHPFSVYSASYEEDILIFVKVLGDWTRSLYRIAGDPGNPLSFPGYIDGPYGYHSIGIEGEKYQNFLCISGGIGVTPIISTAKELLYQMDYGRIVQSLQFVWTGRDSCIVDSVLKPDELKQILDDNNPNVLKEFYRLSDKFVSPTAAVEAKKIQEQTPENKTEDIEKGKIQQDKNRARRPSSSSSNANKIKQFANHFKLAKDTALKNKSKLVGVLTCGPQALIDTCELLAQAYSKDGIRFDVHQEVFNF